VSFGAFEFTLRSGAIPGAGTYNGDAVQLRQMHGLSVEANFVQGTDGTSVTCYVQTSVDGGSNWIDVMSFQFTTTTARKVGTVRYNLTSGGVITPADGSLTANTVQDGVVGPLVRLKTVVVGTYTNGSLSVKGNALS